MQAGSNFSLMVPSGKKRAVARRRRPNAHYRKREHLTETEIEKLIEAAKDNRYSHHDPGRLPPRLTCLRDMLTHLRRDRTSMPQRCVSRARSTANRQRIRFAVTNCGRCRISVDVLTPPAILEVLSAGYEPRRHLTEKDYPSSSEDRPKHADC